MQRTQISLDAEERRLLDAEAARTGRSLSALIREAITRTYGPAGDLESDLRAIELAAGGWSVRDVDGRESVEGLRSGARLDETGTR